MQANAAGCCSLTSAGYRPEHREQPGETALPGMMGWMKREAGRAMPTPTAVLSHQSWQRRVEQVQQQGPGSGTGYEESPSS